VLVYHGFCGGTNTAITRFALFTREFRQLLRFLAVFVGSRGTAVAASLTKYRTII